MNLGSLVAAGAAAYFGAPYLASALEATSELTAGQAALGAGALSFGGSVMTNSTNKSLSTQQQTFSAQQAGSIYQRGAKDMIEAGLNPILAYANPAQVASYQQPNIQNSLGNAAASAVSAYQAHTSGESQKASAYDLTESGHTRKGVRPHEIERLKTVNKHLLAQIEAISFGNRLTEANTAKSIAETGLTNAQTEVATAQAAETRQRTLTGASQEALNKTMDIFRQGEISLQKIQQISMYADIALKSAQAQQSMSQTDLNAAQKAAVEVRTLTQQPAAKFNQDYPRYSTILEGLKRTFEAVPGLSILMKEGL